MPCLWAISCAWEGRAIETSSGHVGRTLRLAREAKGLSLHDVQKQSHGRFKASIVGAYERGERAISLARFSALADFYGIAPDRLLADVLQESDPTAHQAVVLDLTRLSLIDGDEPKVVIDYVREIAEKRGNSLSEVITLRAGDVEAIALAAEVKPRTLLRKLHPALRQPS